MQQKRFHASLWASLQVFRICLGRYLSRIAFQNVIYFTGARHINGHAQMEPVYVVLHEF